MTLKRALILARTWASGGVCSVRDAEAMEYHKMAAAALEAQMDGRPGGQWINVDERLPDGPGHYLICTSINYWHGGCLDKNEGHKYHKNCGTPMGYKGTTKSVLDCYYDITGDWNRVYNSHVTHWMPLPEPPEDG